MSQAQLPSAYRVVDGCTLIELRVRSVRELFNTLDPAPFQRRDLNAEAEEYIAGALREIGFRKPVKMRVYVEAAELAAAQAAGLAAAIHNYFAYRAERAGSDLKQLFGRGLTSLIIALLFMASCLSLRQAIRTDMTLPALDVFREGLLVIAWVAMWRPLEIFLYDWWPIWRQVRLRERLSRLPVELQAVESR